MLHRRYISWFNSIKCTYQVSCVKLFKNLIDKTLIQLSGGSSQKATNIHIHGLGPTGMYTAIRLKEKFNNKVNITILNKYRSPQFSRTQEIRIPNNIITKEDFTPINVYEKKLFKYIKKKYKDIKICNIEDKDLLKFDKNIDIHIDATGGRMDFQSVKDILKLVVNQTSNEVDKLMKDYQCYYTYDKDKDIYNFVSHMHVLNIGGDTEILISEESKHMINQLLFNNRNNKSFYINKLKVVEIFKKTNDPALFKICKYNRIKIDHSGYTFKGQIKRNNIYKGKNTLFWLVGDSCTKFSFHVGGAVSVNMKLIDMIINKL